MAQSQTKPEIQRKNNIPDEHRTPDRNEAAEFIEDMWPATLGEISDESGYSISHIHNTLDKYFERIMDEEPVQQPQNGSNDAQAQAPANNQEPPQPAPQPSQEVQEKRHEVDIPDLYLDNPAQLQAYLHGWGDGYIECRSEVEEPVGGEVRENVGDQPDSAE